eukprot:1138291-Pelagomonas_calceolata.AAC.6
MHTCSYPPPTHTHTCLSAARTGRPPSCTRAHTPHSLPPPHAHVQLVQRSFGHAHSSHSGAEVLSAAELPTLDGQPIVTEAAGPAGVSNPGG